jgi:hypothetical protein
MKIISRFSPLAVLIILLLGSCQLEKLQDPIVITTIENEFYIDIQEYLHPTNRQLRFNIRTIKDQECLNSSIETDYVSAGRQVSLSINSIVPPADCKEGMAPATNETWAGQLSPGIYNFEVALRNTVVNKGKLVVEAERYIINMETQEGIIFLHNNLQKIPSDAFWGYVICKENECADLQQALTEKLNGLAAPANTIYRPGYYGYFEINNNTSNGRNLFLIDPPTVDSYFPILYQLTNDIDENRLKSLLDDFRAEHPDISLKGYNVAGRLF